MSFFNNSILTIKKRLDIVDFLKKTQNSEHIITSIYGQETVSSVILKVEEFLYIDNFIPLKTNQELIINKNYKMHICSVYNCNKYEIDFEASFAGLDLDFSIKSLKFNLPGVLKYTEDTYNITPTEEDNVSVSFKITDLPEFRKINFINSKEFLFNADLDYLIKNNNNRTIYNIDLKLPFDKLTISGNFKKVKKDLFGFENYMFGVKTKEAINRYAQFDFLRKTPEISLHVTKSVNPNKQSFNTRDEINNQYIYIYDLKQAVTEYLAEYLSNRLANPVIQINHFEEIFEIGKQYQPSMLIIDVSIHNIDLLSILRRLEGLKTPIIFLYSKNTPAEFYSIESEYIFARILKPFDGQVIYDIIKSLLKEQE